MAYLLGVDEAGYGPNLGPLIISATLWHVPTVSRSVDLYRWLKDVVTAGPSGMEEARVPIGDSKRLYRPGGGLAGLETGVLAALAASGSRPRTWHQLWRDLDAESETQRKALPWYADYSTSLPVAISSERADEMEQIFAQGLQQAGVCIRVVQSAAVYPQQLNQWIDRFGGKGVALSQVTLKLVKKVLDRADDGPIYVVCDKHGGRNKYGHLLQETFPDYLVEVRGEGRAESLYRTGPRERRVEFRFRAKGESFLPSALASMVSKYLRELSMTAFNQFWRRHQPELKPTAGYPVDARRFKGEIAGVQRQLGIDDHLLWRKK